MSYLNVLLFSHLQSDIMCLHLNVSHSDQKAKKGKEARDPADMVKFSKVNQLPQNNIIIFVLLCVIPSVLIVFVSSGTDPGVSDRLLRQRHEQSGC